MAMTKKTVTVSTYQKFPPDYKETVNQKIAELTADGATDGFFSESQTGENEWTRERHWVDQEAAENYRTWCLALPYEISFISFTIQDL
jgi:hypothetical protein